MCVMCKRLSDSLRKMQKRTFIGKPVRVYFSPSKRSVLEKFKQTKKIATQKVVRAKKTILRLQNYLNDSKQQMKNTSDSTLLKMIEDHGISNSQSELLKEVFAAAKIKNPKNRRYSENWMLLCLLFQIR